MSKFGNNIETNTTDYSVRACQASIFNCHNIETNTTDYSQWGGILFVLAITKTGKAIVYFTHIFITFALMIYKVIK
jgi:hypothetical protein